MEKNSTPREGNQAVVNRLNGHLQTLAIPEKYRVLLQEFYESYGKALAQVPISMEKYEPFFISYMNAVHKQCLEPFLFQSYHERIRHPFDYYQFGLEILKPLIELDRSSVKGLDALKDIEASLAKGHNAIFLANHQTEADPQAISILLEKTAPQFAEKLIFVAGERVITDPLAVPFSMGRNLLCIYSKRYIDFPPELKSKKQLHNKRTMELMSEMLSEGGKAIYIAPSGGRDRPNAQGVFEVAPFDPQSIEMIYLMAERAGHPTFFYPMALHTQELIPPPETIQLELGEARRAKRGKIQLGFGPAIDMEQFPGNTLTDKRKRREARAHHIWELVKKIYTSLY